MLASLTGDVGVVSQAMNGVPVLGVNFVILVCGAVYLGYALARAAGWRPWCSARSAWPATGTRPAGRSKYVARARRSPGRPAQARPRADRGRQGAEDAPRPPPRVRRATCSSRRKRWLRQSQFIGDCLHDAAIAWGRLTFFVAIGLLLFAWPTVQPRSTPTR